MAPALWKSTNTCFADSNSFSSGSLKTFSILSRVIAVLPLAMVLSSAYRTNGRICAFESSRETYLEGIQFFRRFRKRDVDEKSQPVSRIPKLAFARIDDFCEFVVGKHQVSDIKLPLRSVQHFFAKNYALGTESTSCRPNGSSRLR
jgi:hypothetical protein